MERRPLDPRRRDALTAGIAIVICLAAAGCSDEPKNGVTPTAGTVSVSGTWKVGSYLTANPVGFDLGSPQGSYHYAWQRCTDATCASTTSVGTDAGTYRLAFADGGSFVRVGVLASNACAAGCGSSAIVYSTATLVPPVTASPVPGGGTADGPLGGTLFVHVVGADGTTAVAGANVHVEKQGGTGSLVATTDAAGLATLTDASLTGDQDVTVVAAGFVTKTWIGVDAVNVTIPLEAPASTPATAWLGGTLNWTGVARPATGHRLSVNVEYTRTSLFDTPENVLFTQNWTDFCNWDANQTSPPGCNWIMTTRTGPQMPYATLVDCDNAFCSGTNTFLGVFLPGTTHRNLDLAAGQGVTQVLLTAVLPTFASTSVVFSQTPSAALTRASARPFVRAGQEGYLALPLSAVDPTPRDAGTRSVTISLPQVTLPGDAAAALYDVLAVADEPAGTAASRLGVEGLAAGASVALGGWQGPPTGIGVAGRNVSFVPSPGAQLHEVRISEQSTGTVLWSILVLDDSNSFGLLPLTPDPLPAATLFDLVLEGSFHEQPATFDRRGFSLSSFAGNWRTGRTSLSFTL